MHFDKDCSLQLPSATKWGDSVERSAGYLEIFSFWKGSFRKNHLEQHKERDSALLAKLTLAVGRMTYYSQIAFVAKMKLQYWIWLLQAGMGSAVIGGSAGFPASVKSHHLGSSLLCLPAGLVMARVSRVFTGLLCSWHGTHATPMQKLALGHHAWDSTDCSWRGGSHLGPLPSLRAL